jgi:phosphoribosyl-AMP cyclohydrolase
VSEAWLNKINWSEDGLLPAIAQDAETGDILMVAWMNREALKTHRGNRRSGLLVALPQETLA